MMDLITFMKELVQHPVRLRLYQRDPVAYLERDDVDLSRDDKKLLLDLSNCSSQPAWEEVSTVMKLSYPPLQNNQNNAPVSDTKKSFEGAQVEVSSRAYAFIAEATTMSCRLLKHSCVQVEGEEMVLQLNICYTDPQSPYDMPYMVQVKITTHASGLESSNYELALGDQGIEFAPQSPVILRADIPAQSVLIADSWYDLHDNNNISFYLDIDNPQLPPQGNVA